MDLFDLTGKVALVTGSTKGLGETSAKALAKAGADVAVCGRNQADLKRVSTEIQAMGRNSAGFELDVLSKEKVAAITISLETRVQPLVVTTAGASCQDPYISRTYRWVPS